MGFELPRNSRTPILNSFANRRDLLKNTGAVAGLSTIGSFAPLISISALAVTAPAAPPNSFDLRNLNGNNYITGVRNQGGCNSCTAYAVIAAIEGALSIKNNSANPTIHLSEDQLFSCAGPGCDTNAWYPDGALNYCAIPGVANYNDYYPDDGVCHQDPNWSLQQISNWTPLTDATAMKNWISGTGTAQPSPAISVFVLYQDLWDWSPNSVNQVYHHDHGNARNETRIGGHVVCIVGYKDNPGYWICKNSWGTGWGGAGNGFFNIGYGECHIDDYRMYGVLV